MQALRRDKCPGLIRSRCAVRALGTAYIGHRSGTVALIFYGVWDLWMPAYGESGSYFPMY
jgi:hypothetical protein